MTTSGLLSGLLDARVIVCAGTGGVGKTTIAAALGTIAADRGRRTLVLTIDPARRLADALGEAKLGSTPNIVKVPESFRSESFREGGSLEAVMLDPKPTFDRLITRLTDDPMARERILENRIYRHLSEALAGSAEYAAMEQVHEFVESGRYDLVVVDTPPSSHALDFLSAPRRLREFLESRFVHALVRPAMSAGRFGFRLFGRPLHRMFGLLERIAGIGFLDDLSEFLAAIDGLSEGFQERATRVEGVLLGEDTRFVLVCGASAGEDPSTFEFLDELDALRVRLAAVVVNRVGPWPHEIIASKWRAEASREILARDEARLQRALSESTEKSSELADASDPEENADAMTKAMAEEDAALIVRLVSDAAAKRELSDHTLEKLEARIRNRSVSCHAVPDFADDLERLEGLFAIGQALCPAAGTPPPDGGP